MFKAWRLVKGNTEIEILTIDERTKEIVNVKKYALRERMTKAEAQRFFDSHHPHPAIAR